MAHNCVGIFCEDIREEVSGSHTLIGVMPDNINLVGPPTTETDSTLIFPRLGIYLRVNLDSSQKPKNPITARATIPGASNEIPLGEIGPEAINAAFADAEAKSLPVVGLIFKAVLSPVQLRQSGLAMIYAMIEGSEIVGGILNIQVAK
jgi:hypothetical protein